MKSIFIKTLALVLMIFLILNVCTYVTEKQDVITWVKDKFFTKQKNETKQPKDNSNQDIQNIDDYETELIQEFSEIYYVKNKTVKYKSIKEDGVYCPTADILKVKNINGKTIISILLKNYSTEPGIVHKVEVLNEDGKIISGKEKQDIIGGYLSDIYVDKLDINAKITINLFEYYSYLLEDDYNDNNLELLSKATIDIDFSNIPSVLARRILQKLRLQKKHMDMY